MSKKVIAQAGVVLKRSQLRAARVKAKQGDAPMFASQPGMAGRKKHRSGAKATGKIRAVKAAFVADDISKH
jgi:hypothetical protein